MLKDFLERLAADESARANPLFIHLSPFTAWLMENSYADSTIRSKLWLLASFGQWLGRNGLAANDLNEPIVESFITEKLRTNRVHRGNRETLVQFLDHLRKCSIVPGVTPANDASPLAIILNRYERHLRSDRGLVTATVINYLPFVRKFLVERFGRGPLPLGEVRSTDISSFVLSHARTMSCRRAQLMTTAFRSFFRYLLQIGELETDLAASVPVVADWRLSSIPKYLAPQEVDQVLRSCDRQSSTGRRDYTILLLLSRLGLRAGEIVTLQLSDVDWRAGEILVRGKGLLHDRMPLPVDVGEALSSYLRVDRPNCKTRRIFVCAKAPRSGFAGSSTVTTIVRRSIDRAGLHPPFKGAHVLRHSLATTMLRSGASMGEIGEILRHRAPSTTEIYAKLDFEGLRSLAQVWPSGGAQ